jgi:hypothetical protein
LNPQKIKWRKDNKNALCWAFYYVNDRKDVEGELNLLLMRCIFCYDSFVNNHNPSKSNDIKGLTTYYKIHGIISLKKHVDANHAIIAKHLKRGSIV